MHFLFDPSFYVILDNKLIDCMYILGKVVNLNQKITRFCKEYILMSFPAGKLLSVLVTPTSLNFILYFVLFFFFKKQWHGQNQLSIMPFLFPEVFTQQPPLARGLYCIKMNCIFYCEFLLFLKRHVHLVVTVPIVNLQIWRKLICLSYWVHVDELFFRQAFYTVPANLKLNSTFLLWKIYLNSTYLLFLYCIWRGIFASFS